MKAQKERTRHRNCWVDCRWCRYERGGGRRRFYCTTKHTWLTVRRVWGKPCRQSELS